MLPFMVVNNVLNPEELMLVRCMFHMRECVFGNVGLSDVEKIAVYVVYHSMA